MGCQGLPYLSARPPGKGDPKPGSAPGALAVTGLEKHESSPRLAARDGMEQEPYEFRIRSTKRNHRVRRRTEYYASTPSLLQLKRVLSADAHSGLLGVCPAPNTRKKLLRQEKSWAIGKT